jgi:ketosteroid isomerase-like protein
MSSNLDLVRSIYAAWERGDFGSTEWAHPEIEYVYADGPEPGRWTGLAEMAEAWRTRLSTLEDFRFVVDEYREIDNERVLVLVGGSGRFKTSGLPFEQISAGAAHVLQLRDGKVTKLVAYWDRARALADLGLAPEGDTT